MAWTRKRKSNTTHYTEVCVLEFNSFSAAGTCGVFDESLWPCGRVHHRVPPRPGGQSDYLGVVNPEKRRAPLSREGSGYHTRARLAAGLTDSSRTIV